MKVAIITTDNREWSKRYDDPEPYFGTAPEALIQGFTHHPECEVHVVCCVQRPLRSPPKLADNVYYHSVLVPKLGWLRSGYLGCIRGIRRKLNKINPDVVHGQGTERDCAISAVFSGFPNVVTIHGNMRLVAKINKARPFSFDWLAARLEGFTLPHTDGVVCITAYTQRAVAPIARKTWVVPNAVDAKFFDVSTKPATPPQLACVAAIEPRKNQLRLINALAPLAATEKFELIFYGKAAPENAYAAEFFKLLKENPWCHAHGFINRDGLRAAMAKSTALVLPSLEDNCPMSVLEAMAAGIPVAAANVGGVPELILHEKDGLLFDPMNPNEMAAAVSELLLDRDKATMLAAAAKKKALQLFLPKSVAARHIEIYRELIEDKREPKLRRSIAPKL